MPLIRLGAVVLVAVGVAWVGVMARQHRTHAVPHRARAAREPIPVRTAIATQETVEQRIGATGITVPSETASIWVGPGVGLRDSQVIVRAVHVVEGQQVTSGQLLFELDDELFAQAVKRQEMALSAAKAALESIQQLRKERAATGPQLRNAKLAVELAQLELQVARRDLKRCQVTSPIDGFVDEVDVVLGEQVDTARELTLVHKLDPIHVRVDFPQERIDEVFIGQQAQVVLDSFPQEPFAALVVRIAPQADPETRVLPVVLEVDNPEERIKAGITGYARLLVRRDAVTVPTTAVIERGGQAMVFRVEDGKAFIQKVKTGPPADVGLRTIREGLNAGDEVVVYGSEFLKDGDRVNDDWRRWARRD